jgi:hypothetical protein
MKKKRTLFRETRGLKAAGPLFLHSLKSLFTKTQLQSHQMDIYLKNLSEKKSLTRFEKELLEEQEHIQTKDSASSL